jgi:selenocysteine-specific elongation factor
LTKADLADEETLELVRADVEELVEGTSWEGVVCLPVSSHAGTGLAELRDAVRALAETARSEERADPSAFRLPVQRSFALHGAGTVATGVCAAGSVGEGDTIEVQPGGKTSRVRRVHVHGRRADHGAPGLRTALNLPEVEPDDVPRGAVLAAPGSLLSGNLLRASFAPLPKLRLPKHGSPVLVLSGTAAVSARIWLPPEAASLDPGSEVLVDLELEEEIALVPGQRLLLRRPSPASNLGAGRFLSFGKRRLRKRDAAEREALLSMREALDEPNELVARVLDQPGAGEMDVPAMAARLGWRRDATREILQAAAEAGAVREMSPGRFLGMGRAGELAREIQGILGHWRGKHAHRLRIPITRLRERLGKDRFASLQRLSPEELQILGLERRPGLHWGICGVEIGHDWLSDAERWLTRLKSEGLMPSSWEDLAQEGFAEPERLEALAELLEDQGEVVRVEGTMIFAHEVVDDLRNTVVRQLQAKGMDIPALRDRFGTTRKFLMPLLEFLDERGVTARRGGNRILRDAAASLV